MRLIQTAPMDTNRSPFSKEQEKIKDSTAGKMAADIKPSKGNDGGYIWIV